MLTDHSQLGEFLDLKNSVELAIVNERVGGEKAKEIRYNTLYLVSFDFGCVIQLVVPKEKHETPQQWGERRNELYSNLGKICFFMI